MTRKYFAFCAKSYSGPAVLHVADWNRRAMELYRKQGFRIIKTEVIDRTA